MRGLLDQNVVTLLYCCNLPIFLHLCLLSGCPFYFDAYLHSPISMKSSYLFLAPGFEEVEALTPVDVMRRAGIDVKTVSVTASRDVEGAHGVTVKADMTFDEADFSDCDWLVLPGGMPGATNLYECKPLCSLLLKHNAEGGHIAAICASPAVVLGGLGLLDGKEATCYPGF